MLLNFCHVIFFHSLQRIKNTIGGYDNFFVPKFGQKLGQPTKKRIKIGTKKGTANKKRDSQQTKAKNKDKNREKAQIAKISGGKFGRYLKATTCSLS